MAASLADGSSISIASMVTPAQDLCAAIKAIVPVPVPMSRKCLSSGNMVMAAPSSTPSVFTFMALRSFTTSNFLNLKTPIQMLHRHSRLDRESPLFELSVSHEQGPVAHPGKIRIMSHDHYGLAIFVSQREEQLMKLFLGL